MKKFLSKILLVDKSEVSPTRYIKELWNVLGGWVASWIKNKREKKREKKKVDMTSTKRETGMLEVGTHCGYCRQLDFLPFHCTYCNGDFCSTHRLKESHHCNWLLEQEKTKQNASNLGKNGNGEYFQALLPEKANIRLKQNNESHSNSTSIKDHLVKSKNKSALEKLKRFFSKNEKAFSKGKFSTKTSPSNKIILLSKMKRTAKGDSKIPVSNRIYIWVYLVADENDKPTKHEIFINKVWPMGRVLDYVAQQLDVKNVNSKHDASTKEKLFLYKEDPASPLLLDPSCRVANTLHDGDTLYLVRGEDGFPTV